MEPLGRVEVHRRRPAIGTASSHRDRLKFFRKHFPMSTRHELGWRVLCGRSKILPDIYPFRKRSLSSHISVEFHASIFLKNMYFDLFESDVSLFSHAFRVIPVKN